MSVELIIEFKKGNVKAREEIFKLVHKPLYIYALQFISDEMQSEEIVHDCFLKLIEKTNYEYTDMKGLMSVLYKIAGNACKDYLRRTQRDTRTKDEYQYITSKADNGENGIEEEERFARLMETINRIIPLQPDQRRQVLEYMIAFKSAKEIAVLMNINISGVYKHRDAFKEYMQKFEGIDPDDLPFFSSDF